jgi:hypothetical protein
MFTRGTLQKNNRKIPFIVFQNIVTFVAVQKNSLNNILAFTQSISLDLIHFYSFDA